MKKLWSKILVAALAIVLFCLGLYVFVFLPSNEELVYAKTKELLEYKDTLDYYSRLEEFSMLDYIGEDSSNTAMKLTSGGAGQTSSSVSIILEYKNKMFSLEYISGHNSEQVVYTYASYLQTDEFLDNALRFYYVMSNQVTKANSKEVKAIEQSINSYIDALATMFENMDSVIEYQKGIESITDYVAMGNLKDYYYTMYKNYRSALNQYANVILSLRNFVAGSVFNGEFYTDTRFALLDLGAETVAVATRVEEILEIDYANDVYVIMNRYNEYNKAIDLFNTVSEGQFLFSYVNLVKNSPDTLNYLFSVKHSIKVAICNRHIDSISNIPEEDQDDIVNILKVLKY